jgi:hypothetical protein
LTMPATVDVHEPAKSVLMVASNPATSAQTGWPIGFWWSELTHPYWEFVEAGYRVTIASPDGGALQADSWSDPADQSNYSSDDLITPGESAAQGVRGQHTRSGKGGCKSIRGAVLDRRACADVHLPQ